MEHLFVSVPKEAQMRFLIKILEEMRLDYVWSKEEGEDNYELTPAQQARLEEAMKQAREGKTITMDEFKERTASWFK